MNTTHPNITPSDRDMSRRIGDLVCAPARHLEGDG